MRGWCNPHYLKWSRFGDPQGTGKPKPIDKLMSRVTKQSDGCWRVRSAQGKHTTINVDGVRLYSHRFMWEYHHGPIPDSLHVRHKCDFKPCVNPEHLELGTHADNMRDQVVRGRSPKGQRHPGAKLTEDDVRRIRERVRGDGCTQTAVAEEFGVCRSTVSQIVSGRRWQHLQ